MDLKKEEYLRLCNEEFQKHSNWQNQEEFMKVKEVDQIIKEKKKIEFTDYKERIKYEMINNILDNLNYLEKTIKKLIVR
jgi:hypothetical protein